MARITYTNKEDRVVTDVLAKNKVSAADMNEIKASVNALYDIMENLRQLITVKITPANFLGENYQNSNLVGLTADIDFQLFSDEGNGSLLKITDAYRFNSTTGTLTMMQGFYRVNIYKRVV